MRERTVSKGRGAVAGREMNLLPWFAIHTLSGKMETSLPKGAGERPRTERKLPVCRTGRLKFCFSRGRPYRATNPEGRLFCASGKSRRCASGKGVGELMEFPVRCGETAEISAGKEGLISSRKIWRDGGGQEFARLPLGKVTSRTEGEGGGGRGALKMEEKGNASNSV